MGCTDKRSARSALDRDPKTVDEAVSLMRRFHGHEKHYPLKGECGPWRWRKGTLLPRK